MKFLDLGNTLIIILTNYLCYFPSTVLHSHNFFKKDLDVVSEAQKFSQVSLENLKMNYISNLNCAVINRYVGRPSSPKPKTSTQPPKTSSQTNSSHKKNDDQLFEFLNSGSTPGDKKRIANQLRSMSPVETSSPKMPKLNNVETEQKKRSNLTASGTICNPK
jgi:hypothetical protein